MSSYFRRLPRHGETVDQLVRDAQFTVGDLRAGGDVEFLGVADLVVEVQRLEHDHVVGDAERGEILLRTHDEARDRDALAALHRGPQERVRLLGPLLRNDVVRLLEVDRVDLGQLDEVLDVDRACLPRLDGREFLGGEHHVLAA